MTGHKPGQGPLYEKILACVLCKGEKIRFPCTTELGG